MGLVLFPPVLSTAGPVWLAEKLSDTPAQATPRRLLVADLPGVGLVEGVFFASESRRLSDC